MDSLHFFLRMLYYRLERIYFITADKFLFQILAAMVSISLLVAAMALLYPLLEKWFGAGWRKPLWIFAAIRLLIPLHYSVPDAPIRLLPFTVYDHPLVQMTLCFIWMFGAAVYLLYQLAAYGIFRKKCIASMKQIENTEMLAMLSEVCENLHIKKRIPMYQCDMLRAPMVLGFKKQLLLIPDENYTYEDFRYILSHECIHIIKRDIWLKLLLTFVTGLYWFNPFIHWLKSLAFHDIEIVCDSHVVKGKNEEERERYSRAILEVLNRKEKKNIAYSTDFYSGKNSVKERISNILTTKNKPVVLQGVCLFLVLVLYMGGSSLISCGYVYGQEEKEKKVAVDIYKDVAEPPVFNAEAMAGLERLTPVDCNPYTGWRDDYENIREDSTEYTLEGPYQALAEDLDFYKNVTGDLLYTYFDRYVDEDRKQNVTEENIHPFSYLNNISTLEVVAGDMEEFAAYVNFSLFHSYMFDETDLESKNWGIVSEEYLDCSWIVVAKRVQGPVYELEAIVQGEEGLQMLTEKAEMLLAEIEEENRASADAEVTGEEKEEMYRNILESYDMLPRQDIRKQGSGQAKMIDGKLHVTYDGGDTWKEVLISPELLMDRGDGNNVQDGLSIERGTYYVSEALTIFVYGGSDSSQLSVIYSKNAGQTWEKGQVSEFASARKFVISMLNEETGYIAAAGERVMSAEIVYLYKTTDGGESWEPLGVLNENGNPLITGMCFATEEIGFVTCTSGQFPYVYRTTDGGKSWEFMNFNPTYEAYKWYREGYADAQYRTQTDTSPRNRYEELRSFYTIAYAPEFEDADGIMYVAMDGYGELGNNQLKLVTDDYGMNWYIEGIVYRQEYRR